MGHQILTSFGPLILIREGSAERPESYNRGADGKLLDAPKMYVLWYDEKNLELTSEEISLGAAKAIAPEQFKDITQKLQKLRSEVWSDCEAKRKADQDQSGLA